MTQRRNSSTLEGMVVESLRARLLETHTCLPGVIEFFNASTVRADVRIPLKRESEDLDGNRSQSDWPKLTDVPVCFPHFGGFSLMLPVAVGDEVLLVFAQRDISKWIENHLEQPPVSLRAHDLSDAVVLVGMNTKPSQVANYSATDMVLQSPVSGASLSIAPNGNITLTGSKIELGVDGGDDLLSLIEDLITAIGTLAQQGSTPGPYTWVTTAPIDAVSTKIAAMKI